MKAILPILLQKLPTIISLPVAIWGLLGLLLALFLYRKHRDRFSFWFFFLGLAFMLAWRLAIRIVSSRYGLFLVIPCTIGASFLCFQIKDFCSFIPRFPQTLLKRIPLLCMIIFLVIQSWRIALRDTHTTFLTVGRAVAEDVRTLQKENRISAVPVGFCTHLDRIRQLSYYGEISVTIHPLFQPDMSPDDRRSGILRIIHWLCLEKGIRREPLYFFIQEPSSAPLLTASGLGLPETSWQFIASEYRNSRKKAVFRAYRYLPPRKSPAEQK